MSPIEVGPDTGINMPRLSAKRAWFAQAYVANGFNATQAALTAGYSPRTAGSQGHDLLKVPEIRKYIEQLAAQAAAAAQITPEFVQQQMLALLKDCIADGKLSTRARAIEMMGRMHTMFSDKVETQVSGMPAPATIVIKTTPDGVAEGDDPGDFDDPDDAYGEGL